MEITNNPGGELLLAVIGVDAFLESKGPVRMTAEKRKQAARLPSRIRAACRRFFASDDFDRGGSALPAFDYRKALDALTEPPSETLLEERLRGFANDEERLAFAAAVGRALSFLQNVIPKRSRVTATGVTPVAPSGQDVSRFRRAHAVLQDPMTVLEEWNEGILSADQVAALAQVFPAVYQDVRDQVIDALAAAVARRPKMQLPSRKDRALQTLLQASTWNKDLAKDLQRNYAKAEPAQKPEGGGTLKVDTEGMQTPTQRAAAR